MHLAQILQELLESEGYCVCCKHNYETAFAALQDRPFDLLITDVNLGKVSGVELVRHSRCVRPGIGCLLVSGYPIGPGFEDDPGLPGVRFLNKPFSPSELYVCVRELLASHNA